MKPNERPIGVESTLDGEDVVMGVAEGAEAHITSVLTDMYSNRILATIREYSTNAIDAHIEAGFSGPIEVVTPTQLRPTLTIRDYGPGLDADEVRRIYSQYGASTKRGSNTQNGMLGIGSKSGLTYADQFTVVSIKAGRRLTTSISRAEDGTARAKLLSEDGTDDASGVEVQIPVRMGDADRFRDEARGLFRFWRPGTVLLDGEEPEPVEGYRLTDELLVVDDLDSDLVVMANVPYPAKFELLARSSRCDFVNGGYTTSGGCVVAYVDTGDVDFAPSREALMDTGRTRRTVERIKDEFRAAAQVAVQRDVDAASDHAEALRAYAKATKALNLRGDPPKVSYAGDEVPLRFSYPAPTAPDGSAERRGEREELIRLPGTVSMQYRGANESRALDKLAAADHIDTIWVTNFAPSKFTKAQRERLEAYREHLGLHSPGNWVLVRQDTPPNPPWTTGDPKRVWDWEEVRVWRDPSAPAAARTVTGTYPVLTGGSSYVNKTKASDLPDQSLYWVDASVRYGYVSSTLPDEVFAYDAAATVVVLNANRRDKFVRDFPHAVAWTEARDACAFAAWDELTDRQKALLAWRPDQKLDDNWLSLAPKNIDDPDARRLLEATREREKIDTAGFGRLLASGSLPETDPPDLPSVSAVEDRYPLVSSVLTYDSLPVTELTWYVNSRYAARQEGSK